MNDVRIIREEAESSTEICSSMGREACQGRSLGSSEELYSIEKSTQSM